MGNDGSCWGPDEVGVAGIPAPIPTDGVRALSVYRKMIGSERLVLTRVALERATSA